MPRRVSPGGCHLDTPDMGGRDPRRRRPAWDTYSGYQAEADLNSARKRKLLLKALALPDISPLPGS